MRHHRPRRGLRGFGFQGTRSGPWSRAFKALALILLVGCEAPEETQEDGLDPVLLDSVPGLGAEDRVYVFSLSFGESGDVVQPDSLFIEAGDWVDFLTRDGSPRLVTFFPDSTSSPGRTFLEDAGLRVSPPLVAPGSHWVVSFQGAPAGPYPFVVEGGRASARGVVHVNPAG